MGKILSERVILLRIFVGILRNLQKIWEFFGIFRRSVLVIIEISQKNSLPQSIHDTQKECKIDQNDQPHRCEVGSIQGNPNHVAIMAAVVTASVC